MRFVRWTSLQLIASHVLAFIMLIPAAASAESAVVSTQVVVALSPGYMESTYNAWEYVLTNPNVQVRYGATAVDQATGASVCGTPVPVGTHITLRITPRADSDITWNGTGNSWDTPNGYWVAGAAAPAARCSENDKIITFSSNAWGTISFYTPFAVAPPQSTITNTGLDCGAPAADGTVSCTAATAGNASAKFDFGSTYGRFYFHTYAAANTTSNCAGKLASPNFGLGIISPTEPMRLSTAATNDRGSVGYADSGYVIDDAWGVNGHNHRVAFSGWLVTDGRGLQPGVVWKGSYIPQPYDVPITETTISCPITVVDRVGSPPNSPAISGDVCTAGSPRSLTVIATDPDADKIRYAVDWDANGTIDEFVPAAGYVPSGTSRTASRTYATAGIKRVKVLTQDETGLTSSWSTHVFTCSGVSVVEVQPQPQAQANATPDLNIRAVPSLVRPGRTTKLSWSSSSMRSCSVSGSNGDLWEPTETDKRLESPIGGDQSSTIKAETVFMLSCDGLDGKAYSKQATVRVIPSWTEQ